MATCGLRSEKHRFARYRRSARPRDVLLGGVLCCTGVRPSTLALAGLFALCASAGVPAAAAVWPSAVLRAERELHSQDVDVRRRAAQSLRDLPASSSVRLARAALEDADVEVRLA